MKGTLFSADFIKDADANLRLLELNTDTGFITNTLSNRFDFTSFISVLNSNSITELVIVYKSMQTNFVDLLKTTIATDATFITTVTEQIEDANAIYPSAPTDSTEKFILRLAYDENALFDSTYCKERANVQKLFYDNSETGSIPEYYFSSSDYIANTLTSDINDHSSLPDFVTKPKSEEHTPLSFYNILGSDSSSADRTTDFVDNYINKESHTIEKFHYNAADITDDGKISGYRIIGIVYGADIEYVNIGQWRVQSFLDIPTDSEVDYILQQNEFATRYSDKHYFQLTSNWIRTTSGEGLLLGQSVLNPDNTSGPIELLAVNDVVKSIFINGLPDGDVASMYDTWSSSGISLPSGSYVTSSIVESINELSTDKTYGVLGELKVSETDAIYSTIGKHYLVYSSGSDAMSFKNQYTIDSTDDFLVDPSGSLIPITSNKLIIVDDSMTDSLYQLDVETLDTYFISSSVAPFIVHNAPCFVAGTLIEMEDGVSNKIEDVVVGDRVWTWNHTTNETEIKKVLEVTKKENQETVIYTLQNDETIQATLDHPLYIKELGDYASYTPSLTLSDSGLEVKQIQVGHTLHPINQPEQSIRSIELGESTTVYNLKSVEDNHNFYANGFLVHNRSLSLPCCFLAGTEISLSNGDVKNIEDVIVGDVVESYVATNNSSEIGEFKEGTVTDIEHRPTVGSHEKACNSLGDTSGVYSLNHGELMFTPEHPFLTKRGWASLLPISTQEPYLSQQDEELILSIGDFIIEDGKWVEIKTIEHHPMNSDTPVYNITVAEYHTYIANNIVVHNK